MILFLTITSCVTTEYIYPDPPIFGDKPDGVVLIVQPDIGEEYKTSEPKDAVKYLEDYINTIEVSHMINEYRLMVLDVQWLKWAAFAEWKAGIITEEKYNKRMLNYRDILNNFDIAFKKYKDAGFLE